MWLVKVSGSRQPDVHDITSVQSWFLKLFVDCSHHGSFRDDKTSSIGIKTRYPDVFKN